MNQLRRLVLPAMVAGLALMAWSSSASAGEYIGKFQPGNHQSNSVPAVHDKVPVHAVNSSVSSLAAMHHSSAASGGSASHATAHFGNAHNTILPH
jgi:hypothetical protein